MRNFKKSRFLSAEKFQLLSAEEKKKMIEQMEKEVDEEIKKDADPVNRKVQRKTVTNIYLRIDVQRVPVIQSKTVDITKFEVGM